MNVFIVMSSSSLILFSFNVICHQLHSVYLSYQKLYLGLFIISSMSLVNYFNTTAFISFFTKCNIYVSSQLVLIVYFPFYRLYFPESLHASSSLIGCQTFWILPCWVLDGFFILTNIFTFHAHMQCYSEIV